MTQQHDTEPVETDAEWIYFSGRQATWHDFERDDGGKHRHEPTGEI